MPSSVPKTVLVVFPEPSIRELIAASLRHAGYYVITTAKPDAARALAGQVLPDVVLADLDDDPAGVAALAASVRESALPERSVSVIALSGDTGSCCDAREPGGAFEECVAKPFSPHELVRRLNRLVAPREAPAGQGTLRVGPLELDPARHAATAQGPRGSLEIPLGSVEFKLLQQLMKQPDRVLRREQLLSAVWGPGSTVDLRTVDQAVKRLRQGLGAAGLAGLVQTVRSVGYRLAWNEPPRSAFGASPPGGATSGPAEPDPRLPLGGAGSWV